MNPSTIPKSRYLDFFKNNQDTIRAQMRATGDILLIERMKFPEAKTSSGIILASDTRAANTFGGIGADKPGFYRILFVGEGYFDDDTKEDLPLDISPGGVALLGQASVKMFSLFPLLEAYEPDSIGIARETDIQLRFNSEESFVEFLRSFNEATKAAMVPGG